MYFKDIFAFKILSANTYTSKKLSLSPRRNVKDSQTKAERLPQARGMMTIVYIIEQWKVPLCRMAISPQVSC